MPTLVPIFGGDLAPSIEVLYTARSSMNIITADLDTARESIEITGLSSYAARETINVISTPLRTAGASIGVKANTTLTPAHRTVNVVNGDNFIILVDALAEELSGDNLGSFGQLEINAQLLVNTVEVPIKSFSFQVPTGRLGSILNVVLADPSITPVPAGASVKFQLVVRIGGTNHPFVLMDNGKLQERDSTVQWRGGNGGSPVDEVTFGALDVIADKFGLAPRRPVVMFDPSRVKFDEVSTRNEDAVRTETGQLIYPVIEPVYGLTMRQILSRAYSNGGGGLFMSPLSPAFSAGITWGLLIGGGALEQQGSGFSSVITNIPDYPVRRADFSIEGGWHDGAQPVVAMYNPLYFVESGSLFIIDVDRVLPAGATGHQISLGDHKSMSERIAYKADANAILLTYQYSINDPSEEPQRVRREVFTDTSEENEGTVVGGSGYSKTTTRKWDYEYYLTNAPSETLASYPKSVDIETEQTLEYAIKDPTTGEVTTYRSGLGITHRESSDYIYEGELLVGSRKIISGIVNVGASASFQVIPVEREDIRISWTDDPANPGTKIQERVTTDVQGLVAYNDTTETVIGPAGEIENTVRAFPLLLAQASGIIKIDTILNTGLVPIKSIRETLHRLNGNQFNVLVVETDYLNNTVKKSYSQPVTGSNTSNQFGSKSRTVLFTDSESESEIGPRIPIAINAYELPRIRAFELARNALLRIKNPLMQLPISLPGVDFTIARGSIIQGQRRNASYTPNYFVTGYTISGESLGQTGHRIAQQLETIQLLEVT